MRNHAHDTKQTTQQYAAPGQRGGNREAAIPQQQTGCGLSQGAEFLAQFFRIDAGLAVDAGFAPVSRLKQILPPPATPPEVRNRSPRAAGLLRGYEFRVSGFGAAEPGI